MTLEQAVKEWVEARNAVMAAPLHDPELWTRLSRAESQLQRIYHEQRI